MRRLAFFLALVAFLLALPLVSLVPVTPTAATRNPAGCLIEPLSPDSLKAMVGRFPSAAIAPASAPRPNPYPNVHLPFADDRTIAAMWATMREAVACARAGDAPRLYALYTDDFLRRTLGAARAPAVGSGLPEVPVWRGSWVLKDGRVGAVFSEPQPAATPDGGQPIYYVFARVGGRWLIDEAVPFSQEMAGTESASAGRDGAPSRSPTRD